MGSDKSKTHYQGLLIEDQRVTIWDSETTAQSAGPRPGVPQPLNKTGMTLQSSGTQSPNKDLRVRTQRGGFAEPDGAGFVWRNGTGEDWRGYDIPGTITHFESLKWSDLSAPIKWYVQPHCVTLSNHTVLAAFYERDDGEALPFAVTVGKRTGSSWSYTRVTETATQPTVNVCEFHPALLVLPSGRVLLFHWIQDQSRNEAQVRAWYSDDDGVTWAIMQDNILAEPVSLDAGPTGYAVRRMRVAYGAGQILMLCHLRSNNGSLPAQDVLRQYASADLGNTFDAVTEWDPVENAGGWPDIEYTGGHFLCGYIQSQPIAQGLCTFFKLGNAYSNSASVEHVALDFAPAFGDFDIASSTFIVDGDLALASTTDGALYVFGRAVNTTHFSSYEENSACFVYRSDDFGSSWEPVGQFEGFGGLSGLVGCWYNANTATTCPTAFAATECEGRIVLVHNWKASPGAVPSLPTEPSLGASYLGGSSNVTLPGYQRFQTSYRRVNFEDTWFPFDLPSVTPTRWASGWATAGGASEALEGGALIIGGSVSGDRLYACGGLPAGHSALQGLIVSFSMTLTSGGSMVSDDVAARFVLDDGAASYEIVIRIDVSGAHVVEAASGSILGTIPIDANNGIDVLFAMREGQFCTWARPRSSDADRLYQPPVIGTVAPTPPGAGSSVMWGHLVASASVSAWHSFQMVTGPYTGLHLAQGIVNPNDLMPHPYSISGTYVDDGVSVRATDGTTIRGDEFSIATRYDYDASNVLNPNPRKTWRSVDLTGQAIGLQVSTIGNTSLQSDLIGLALYNCNFPSAALQAYDATTSTWSTLCNIEMNDGMSGLTYVRDGDSIRPDAAPSAAEPLFFAGELEGALWSFGNVSARKIKSHLTGKWSDTGTRMAEIVLNDVDAADPPHHWASGAGSISSRNAVFVIHLQGSRYQGFRLLMTPPSGPMPAMADDYFEIGRAIIGPVVLHGDSTSWGRTIESSAGVELQEARDRTTRAKKIAPTRRIIEYGFTDGVDTSNAVNPTGDADPDFAMADDAATSRAVAFVDAAPWDFDGVFHLLSGAASQVVYLPRVEKLDPFTHCEKLVRKHQHALCRITSPVRLESVQGDESDDEVLRVATITLTEDV